MKVTTIFIMLPLTAMIAILNINCQNLFISMGTDIWILAVFNIFTTKRQTNSLKGKARDHSRLLKKLLVDRTVSVQQIKKQ